MAGSLDNIAAQDEIFGPVAYLAPFRDEAQAIRMANATHYGLANSVWSSDLGRATPSPNRWSPATAGSTHTMYFRMACRTAREPQRHGRRREQRRDAVRLLAQPVDGAPVVSPPLALNQNDAVSRPQTPLLKLGVAAALCRSTRCVRSRHGRRVSSFRDPVPAGRRQGTVARAVTERLPRPGPVHRHREQDGRQCGHRRDDGRAGRARRLHRLWDGNNHLSNRLLIKDLAFDYRTAFVPITLTARLQVVAVRLEFPARTIDEFLAYVRANPGKVSCGTPPSGGMGHLALELLQKRAGIQLIHTPYRGGPEAVRDVMGGQIDAVLLTTSTILPALQEGKARLLAITSAQRSALYRGAGDRRALPGYDMDDWNGCAPPARGGVTNLRTGEPAIPRIPGERNLAPSGDGREEFAAWLTRQREVIEGIILDANIKITRATTAAHAA